MPGPIKHTNRHQGPDFTLSITQNIAIIVFLMAVIRAILRVANAGHLGLFQCDQDERSSTETLFWMPLPIIYISLDPQDHEFTQTIAIITVCM